MLLWGPGAPIRALMGAWGPHKNLSYFRHLWGAVPPIENRHAQSPPGRRPGGQQPGEVCPMAFFRIIDRQAKAQNDRQQIVLTTGRKGNAQGFLAPFNLVMGG